jgi:ketosteroid isomerase-like protein
MKAAVRLWVFVCAAMLAAPGALAADPSWNADERAAAAADEAFYQASLTRKGQAWGDFADEDMVMGEAHGKKAIAALYDKVYAQPGFKLDWHPNYAKSVGDIVVTSGRYERHAPKNGADDHSTGSYVTVWQRQADGSWRYVWDGGTRDK